MKKNKKEKKETEDYGITNGICIGLCIGIAVGVSTDNIGLWLPIGLCFGLCLAPAFTNKKDKNNKNKER